MGATNVFQRGEVVPIWGENKVEGVLTNPSGGIKVALFDPDDVLAKEVDGDDIDEVAMDYSATGKYVYYYYSKAPTTLASDVTVAATSITVATGEGSKLPSANFYIQIAKEIIKCSSRTDDVLTVVRGQKGTTASAHSSGHKVWRIKGAWKARCTAIDGSGDTQKDVITWWSFKLV